MSNKVIQNLFLILAYIYSKVIFVSADSITDQPLIVQCESNQYLNTDNECINCHESCQQCSYDQFSKINQHCIMCAQNYYYDLIKMQCSPTCGEGQRINNKLNICEKCAVENCSLCYNDKNQCSKCNNNFLLSNNECAYQGQEDLIYEKYLSILMKDKFCKQESNPYLELNGKEESNDDQRNENQICNNDLITCPIIYNQLNNQDQMYLYSLVDEINQRLYLFTQYKIQMYNYPQLNLLYEGKNILPNTNINYCGLVDNDLIYFYCAYGSNIIVKYKRDTIQGSLHYQFQDKVYSIQIFGLYQFFWDTGRIPTIGSNLFQIYDIKQNSTQTIQLPTGKYYRYFEVKKLQFCFEASNQILYLLNSTEIIQNNSNINIANNKFIVLSTQFTLIQDIFVIEETNFYIFGDKQFYCKWSLDSQNSRNISLSQCWILNINQEDSFYLTIATSNKEYKSKEKVLLTYSQMYSTLYVFDLKQGWENISIIFDRIEYLVSSYYFTDGCLFYVITQGIMSVYCLKQSPENQSQLSANEFDFQNGLVSQSLWDFSGIYLFNIIYLFPELIVVNQQEVLAINLLSYMKISQMQNQTQISNISKADILKGFLQNPTYEILNQIGYINVINQSKVVSSHFIFKVQNLDDSQMKRVSKSLVIIESFNLKALYFQGNKSYSQSVVRLRNDLGTVLDSIYIQQMQIIILWYTQLFHVIDSTSLNLFYQSQLYDKQGMTQPNTFRMLISSDQIYLTIVMIDNQNKKAFLTFLQFDNIHEPPNELKYFYIQFNTIWIDNKQLIAVYSNSTQIYMYDVETQKETSSNYIQEQLINSGIFVLSPSCSLISSYYNSAFYFQRLDKSNTTFSYKLQKQLSVQSYTIVQRNTNQNVLIIFTDAEILLLSWNINQESESNFDLSQEYQLPCIGKKEIIYPTDYEIYSDNTSTIQNYLYVKSDGQLIYIVYLMGDNKFEPLKKLASKIYINGVNILKRNESDDQQQGIKLFKADIIAIKGLSSTYLYSRENEKDNYKLYFNSQISCLEIGFLLNELICKNSGEKETFLLPLYKSPFLVKYSLFDQDNSIDLKIDNFTYLPHKQLIIMKSSYKIFKSVHLNTQQEINFFQTQDIQYSYFGDLISKPEQDLFSGFYYNDINNIFLQIKSNSLIYAYKVSEDGKTFDILYQFERSQILCIGLIDQKNYLLFWLPQTNSLICFDYIEGKVIIETQSLITQDQKSKKLFDYNDEYLYFQIYMSLYKFSFKTGQIVFHIILNISQLNQFAFFSQIYADPNDDFLILLNQMDIVIAKMKTQELEYRRFQAEPEFFNPNILQQLNIIYLIPVSSSIAYFLKLPSQNVKASTISIYKTDVQYSIYTYCVDSKNQIMSVLTVDSVIHFIDLSQIVEVKVMESENKENEQNQEADAQSWESNDDQDLNENLSDVGNSDIPQTNSLKECLSFSLHELLEDLVNSNGQENPNLYDNLSLVLYYQQDVFFISFLSNIYTYSISKKQIVFIIRHHQSPIIKLLFVNDLLLLSGDSHSIYLWSVEEIIRYKFLDLTMRNLQNIAYTSNYVEQEANFTFYNQDKGQLFIIDKETSRIQKRVQIQQDVYTQNYYSNNSWQMLNKDQQRYFNNQEDKQSTQEQEGQDQSLNKSNDQSVLVISLGDYFFFFNQEAESVGKSMNLVSYKQIIGISSGNIFFLSQKNNLYVCNVQTKQIIPISKIKQNFLIIESYLKKSQNGKAVNTFSDNLLPNLRESSSSKTVNQVFLILENGQIGVVDFRADPFSTQNDFKILNFFDLNTNSTKNIISCMQIDQQYIILLNNQGEIILLKFTPQISSVEDSQLVIIKTFQMLDIQFNDIKFDSERERVIVFSSVNDSIYLLNYLPYTSDDFPQPEPTIAFYKVSMNQVSNKLNKFLISECEQYYIIFSSLYIKIYYAQDFKLKAEIKQIYSQSEIQFVKILSENILYVQAQTEIVIYVLQNVYPFYFISHNLCLTYPYLYHYTIDRQSQDSHILNLELYLQSQSGFTHLQLPVDITQIDQSQRLRNLHLALNPEPSCQRSELFELKQQVTAQASLSYQQKLNILNLFKQTKNEDGIASSTYQNCLLSFNLEYTTKNYNYIKNLYVSIIQANFKSIQKYTPLTIKIKVKESERPQSLEVISSFTDSQDSQILIYSENKENSTILLNQNTKLSQKQNSSLVFYNLTFQLESQTNKSNRNSQVQDNNISNQSIVLKNKQRVTFESIDFNKQNNQFQIYISNISLTIIDNIQFKDYNFSYLDLNISQPTTPNNNYNSTQSSSQQNWNLSYNQTQSFTQFTSTETLKISNLLIENVTCLFYKQFFFHAENANSVLIANVTVQNIDTDFLKLFSFRQINTLNIQNVTIRNINLKTFTMFVIQNVQNLSIKNITIQNMKQKVYQKQYFSKNYLIYSYGVNKARIQDIIFQNLENTFFIYSDVLTLSENELIVGNQNIAFGNIKVIDASYIYPSNNSLDYSSQFSSFIKLVSKNVAFNQVYFKNISFDTSLMNIQSNIANFSDFNISQFQQSLRFRPPQCIVLQVSNYLEMTQITYLNNTNLCTDIITSELVYIQNFTVKLNKLVTPQQMFLSISIISFSEIQKLRIQSLKLLENYPNYSYKSFIVLENIKQFNIQESEFISNIANNTSGGALAIQNNQNLYDLSNDQYQSEIIQTKFINNSSPNNFGGSLLIDNADMDIKNCQFINNYAQIGGAIRIVSNHVVPLFYMKHLIKQSIFFQNNAANFYGNNIGFYPKEIRIYRNEEYFPQLKIENFRSGDYLQNLYIKFIDYEEKDVYLQDLAKKSIDNVDQIASYSLDITSDNIFIPNYQISIDSKFRTYCLNATVISHPQQQQQITISTKQTFPVIILDQENQKVQIANKRLTTQISIIARLCIQGEVYSKQNDIYVCEPCPEGKYSFLQPKIDDTATNQCKICPPYASSCDRNVMSLKNGYWRENDQSDNVYSCQQYSENCKAEDVSSINYCREGYVGPLCSSCDISGKTWGSRYAKISGVYCSSCKTYGIQIGMFIGFLFLTVSYLLFLMRQNMSCTKKKIQAEYLKILGMIRFGKSAQFERTSILSKILMHYVQILLIIMNSSELSIPSFFNFFQVSGDPVLNIYYSFDCLISYLDIQIVFARIIWLTLFVVFLVLVGTFYFFLHYLLDKSQQKQLKFYLSYCSMAVKMVLIYTFPGLLSQITKSITCVKFDKGSYSLADLQFSCDEQNYRQISYYFVLPLFFILVLVIPLAYLIRIRRIIKNPSRISLLKSFGFLFYDYKQNAYYWEILKLQLKALIIVSNTLLHSYIFNKLLFSLVLIMIYKFLHLRVKPYISHEYNHLDLMAHLICNFTIVIILISISTPFPLVSYICFSVIVLINALYIIRLLQTYFSGIIVLYNRNNRSLIQKFLFLLKSLFPSFLNCIKLQKQNSFKILLLWQTLSKHVMDKKDVLKQSKSSISSSSQSHQQNEESLTHKEFVSYDQERQTNSQMKKLNYFEHTSNDFYFNNLIQASKSKICGISHNTSISQMELSMQDPVDLNQPKYLFNKQIKTIHNMNFPLQNTESPCNSNNKTIQKLQQNQLSVKNSDSDTDAQQDSKKQGSTNVYSHITHNKDPQSVNQSSNSLQSLSNFLSQKSFEKLSSNKQNQTPRSKKKNYIQKVILINRIKEKKFSLKGNEKIEINQNESQKQNNAHQNYQEKKISYQKQKSFFSLANQDHNKFNNYLQNDCQTQVSEIISPIYVQPSIQKEQIDFNHYQKENENHLSQYTDKTFQPQKCNDSIKQLPLFCNFSDTQQAINMFNFQNFGKSEMKYSQQSNIQSDEKSSDSSEDYQAGGETHKKVQDQSISIEQNGSMGEQGVVDQSCSIKMQNSCINNKQIINANIPKESEQLVSIQQISKLFKSSSQ